MSSPSSYGMESPSRHYKISPASNRKVDQTGCCLWIVRKISPRRTGSKRPQRSTRGRRTWTYAPLQTALILRLSAQRYQAMNSPRKPRPRRPRPRPNRHQSGRLSHPTQTQHLRGLRPQLDLPGATKPIVILTDDINTQLLMGKRSCKNSTRWLDMRWFFIKDAIFRDKITCYVLTPNTMWQMALRKHLRRHLRRTDTKNSYIC